MPGSNPENKTLSWREWELLHKVMDRVDALRHTDEVNLDRVRQVAVKTYEEQGIHIDPSILDRALSNQAKLSPEREDSRHTPGLDGLDWPKIEKAAQTSKRLVGLGSGKESPSGSRAATAIQQKWEEREAPFKKHRPASDSTLQKRLGLEMAEQSESYKINRSTAKILLGATVSGLMITASAIAFGLQGSLQTSPNWTLLAFFAGVATTGVCGVAAKVEWEAMKGNALALTLLVRGKNALRNKNYESSTLREALRSTGYLICGSLQPLASPIESSSIIQNRVRAVKAIDQSAADAWQEWAREAQIIRQNDLAVMGEFVRVAQANPLRAANWVLAIKMGTQKSL